MPCYRIRYNQCLYKIQVKFFITYLVTWARNGLRDNMCNTLTPLIKANSIIPPKQSKPIQKTAVTGYSFVSTFYCSEEGSAVTSRSSDGVDANVQTTQTETDGIQESRSPASRKKTKYPGGTFSVSYGVWAVVDYA